MKKNSHFILVGFILFILSCDSTEPPQPPDDNSKLEFSWTVDTLINPNGYGVVPLSIWGSSSKNTWIAGYNLAWQAELFHHDGTILKRVTPDLGFNYSLTSMYGFSSNNIYCTGYEIIRDTALHSESLILHYDGQSWQQESIYTKGGAINYIHGINENDIWASGKYVG